MAALATHWPLALFAIAGALALVTIWREFGEAAARLHDDNEQEED